MRHSILRTMAVAALAVLSTASLRAQEIEYTDVGYPLESCASCEAGIPVCSQCLDPHCDGYCHLIHRRLGFVGGVVYDIPLEGMFLTGTSVSSTAGTLGVDPAVLPGATPIDLTIGEMGFDDIYDGFFGYSANITLMVDRSTKLYVGYREVNGQANLVEIGQAIIDPAGAATQETVTAQFDDYEEWAIQFGFLTSKAAHRCVDLVWGCNGGVAWANNVNGTLSISNTGTLTNVPFFDDTHVLKFGVNLGFRWNVRPNVSILAMTGAEYRTHLDQDDSVLATLGLENVNNGSGFVTLPILVGGTVNF